MYTSLNHLLRERMCLTNALCLTRGDVYSGRPVAISGNMYRIENACDTGGDVFKECFVTTSGDVYRECPVTRSGDRELPMTTSGDVHRECHMTLYK